MTIPVLSTSRLLLRDWKESDCQPFAQMNSDPDVMRFFPKPLSSQESDAFIDRITRHFHERGYGLWAVELKASKQFIGFIGLNYTDFQSDFTPCVEIGWRLAKAYWHQGYATEGAQVCLEFGFTQLDLPVIYSFTSVLNVPSEKVMQRLGMTFTRHFDHPKIQLGHPLRPHVLYRIRKDEYPHR